LNIWHPDMTRGWRRGLVAGALMAASFMAAGAPRAVEAFADGAWASLQSSVQRTTVVVFTATYCSQCPAAFDQLAQAIAKRKLRADLFGVVMDRSPGAADPALLGNAHFRQTSRLFAFDGQEARLRYAVDPKWRGVTPYIAVLAPGRPPLLHVGPPSDAELQAWDRLSTPPR